MFPISKNIIRCLGLIMVIGLHGCGGSNSSVNTPTAIAVVNSAPVSACSSGGITIQSGADANGDQMLGATEVSNEQFICNGTNGVNGAVSLIPLISLNPETVGVNCPSGGTQVNVGLDANKNNILDTTEIKSMSYVCNGSSSADGINGVDGRAGNNGTNGTAGVTGSTGSIGATGAAGSNGTNGTAGSTGAIGATGAAGSNGTNGTAGAMGSTGSMGTTGPVGANGMVSLVNIINEPSGLNCAYTGLKVSSGIDTNNNNSLDTGEIQTVKYVCNGATGATGATGGIISAFGYIFNTAGQTVAVASPILFDSNSVLQGIEHSIGTGNIKVVEAGTYLISFSISGTEPNQFAIFVNGVVASGSIYGTGAGTQPNNGQVILALAANDLLSLVNHTSTAAVGLQALAGGTKSNVNASVVIQRLK